MACWTGRLRPNVGIILLNDHNKVFWGKRASSTLAIPEGGIKHGETPSQAMFRELYERDRLSPEQVRIVARTREWLPLRGP